MGMSKAKDGVGLVSREILTGFKGDFVEFQGISSVVLGFVLREGSSQRVQIMLTGVLGS